MTKVAIGDPKTRWGSCASSGTIRYSWRLILMPDFVRRSTVAHEVAHRLHMNHGAHFYRVLALLDERDPDDSRRRSRWVVGLLGMAPLSAHASEEAGSGGLAKPTSILLCRPGGVLAGTSVEGTGVAGRVSG